MDGQVSPTAAMGRRHFQGLGVALLRGAVRLGLLGVGLLALGRGFRWLGRNAAIRLTNFAPAADSIGRRKTR
jgi:hypothetical protein